MQILFVDQKECSKLWENVIFQHHFQRNLSSFDLWLPPNYWKLFNYRWLMYVKLIIGVEDQRLLTGTKWDVYKVGCVKSTPYAILHWLMSNNVFSLNKILLVMQGVGVTLDYLQNSHDPNVCGNGIKERPMSCLG